MKPDSNVKTCKLCAMEIPMAARKCPHCHHFQSRGALCFYHPAFGFVIAMITTLIFIFVFVRLFDPGENFQDYKNEILITESQIYFGEKKSGTTIAVIGTITNKSEVPWKAIVFEVDFKDAKGRRFDTGQKEESFYFLPPKESRSFKVSFFHEFPETNYVSHNIRVVTAQDARKRW